MEHATLAARLLARSSAHTPKDGEIREAVTAAAKLWGAVLAHGTEGTIEEARLGQSLDREKAVARWNQWQRKKLGLEEQVAAWERDQAQWKARADRCFKGRSFPASGDDVLQWIMAGKSNLGRSKESRHAQFSLAWLEWAGESTRRQCALQWGHPPGRGEALEMASRRQDERRAKGEPPEPWPYEGPQGASKLDADVEAERKKYQEDAAADLKKRIASLEEMAAAFRTDTLSQEDAVHWYIVWTKYSDRERRKKGGEMKHARAEEKKSAGTGK